MMPLDCYFIIADENLPIVTVCTDCLKTNDENAYFWQGSVKGYGNYDLECSLCQKSINKVGEK